MVLSIFEARQSPRRGVEGTPSIPLASKTPQNSILRVLDPFLKGFRKEETAFPVEVVLDR